MELSEGAPLSAIPAPIPHMAVRTFPFPGPPPGLTTVHLCLPLSPPMKRYSIQVRNPGLIMNFAFSISLHMGRLQVLPVRLSQDLFNPTSSLPLPRGICLSSSLTSVSTEPFQQLCLTWTASHPVHRPPVTSTTSDHRKAYVKIYRRQDFNTERGSSSSGGRDCGRPLVTPCTPNA